MPRLTKKDEIEKFWKELQIKEPTTGWGILDRVVELIEQEPRRMRMRTWGETAFHMEVVPEADFPECGTVACIAGWAEILIAGDISKFVFHTGTASAIAGPAWKDLFELFIDQDLMDDPRQGTPEHAARVVKAIREFQKDHEENLRARMVEPRKED